MYSVCSNVSVERLTRRGARAVHVRVGTRWGAGAISNRSLSFHSRNREVPSEKALPLEKVRCGGQTALIRLMRSGAPGQAAK